MSITAAWMWDSFNGVRINSGFGSEGSANLRIWAEDCKIEVNEEFCGAYKMLEKAKEISELEVTVTKKEIEIEEHNLTEGKNLNRPFSCCFSLCFKNLSVTRFLLQTAAICWDSYPNITT